MDRSPGSLVDRLRQRLVETIGELVPRGSRVALLDFPTHGNVGDSAIWLGELATLRTVGATLAYAASIRSYDAKALRRRLGRDGIVLLSGGGNFGDLWPWHQVFRERILADHPGLPVVQLPQSMYFSDRGLLERARAVLDAHPRLTLLVRDRRSLEFASRTFAAPTRLCPDMAFGLGTLRVRRRPACDILWLSRNDQERGAPSGPRPGRVDWVTDPPGVRATLDRMLTRLQARGVRTPAACEHWWMRTLATARLRRGCALLARGRVVVTNRLHGQILSLLMGLPHFVSDTRQGKVSAFFETWLSGDLPGSLCGSEAEALHKAESWLESESGHIAKSA